MVQISRLFKRKAAARDGIIRTARLVLRPLEESDVGEIARLAGDWDIASMTARIPYPYTVEDAHQWFDSLEEGEVVCAITADGDDSLLGITGYVPSRDERSAEIGYWLGKPYWGRGYATEAAGALIDYCFWSVGFDGLTCCHFADNAASARVIGKLGFVWTGSCECWCEARRRSADAHHYELLRPKRRRRLWGA
ncbi:MAG: GNAT family N-acetyltransferase [Hyphomicrobiaceae bacterium]